MTTEHMDEPRREGDSEEGMHVSVPEGFAYARAKMHRPKPDRFATKAQPKRETLQPYDADSACPKCGAKGAETMWRPGTLRLSHNHLDGTILAKADGPAEPGWMQRTCINCDYRWAEAPVDAS